LARSTTSYSVELDDDLRAQLRDLPKAERHRIDEIIRHVQESFGQPHQHSGTGIRNLTAKGSRYPVYECRVSKSIRLVFSVPEISILYFHIMGTHDEVRRFLKSFL
jgi:mRNA-degrading endonuclease RelE of RelBE toxin-antitoxin system